jgi:hypothetical protein
MLKKFSFAILFIFGIIFFNASTVQAVKLVPSFQDNSTLQPMPYPDAKPNISGNVNSVTTRAQNLEKPQQETSPSETEENDLGTLPNTTINGAGQKSGGTTFRIAIYTVLALGVVATATYIARRKVSKF